MAKRSVERLTSLKLALEFLDKSTTERHGKLFLRAGVFSKSHASQQFCQGQMVFSIKIKVRIFNLKKCDRSGCQQNFFVDGNYKCKKWKYVVYTKNLVTIANLFVINQCQLMVQLIMFCFFVHHLSKFKEWNIFVVRDIKQYPSYNFKWNK